MYLILDINSRKLCINLIDFISKAPKEVISAIAGDDLIMSLVRNYLDRTTLSDRKVISANLTNFSLVKRNPKRNRASSADSLEVGPQDGARHPHREKPAREGSQNVVNFEDSPRPGEQRVVSPQAEFLYETPTNNNKELTDEIISLSQEFDCQYARRTISEWKTNGIFSHKQIPWYGLNNEAQEDKVRRIYNAVILTEAEAGLAASQRRLSHLVLASVFESLDNDRRRALARLLEIIYGPDWDSTKVESRKRKARLKYTLKAGQRWLQLGRTFGIGVVILPGFKFRHYVFEQRLRDSSIPLLIGYLQERGDFLELVTEATSVINRMGFFINAGEVTVTSPETQLISQLQSVSQPSAWASTPVNKSPPISKPQHPGRWEAIPVTEMDDPFFWGEWEHRISGQTWSVGPYRFHEENLARLEPGKCLDDEIINCLLKHYYVSSGAHHSFYLANSFQFCLHIPRRSFLKAHGNLKVVAPYHRENHWVLLCIECETKSFRVYDSMRPKEKKNAEKMWREVASDIFRIDNYDSLDGWCIEVVECARQNNHVDCGVHLIRNAICLFYGYNTAERINCDLLREKFAKIVENSANKG